MATDGGVYWCDDGGRKRAQLADADRVGDAGSCQHRGTFSENGNQPALYFGCGDNNDFFTRDGGQHWEDPRSNCGDCDAWFTDMARPAGSSSSCRGKSSCRAKRRGSSASFAAAGRRIRTRVTTGARRSCRRRRRSISSIPPNWLRMRLRRVLAWLSTIDPDAGHRSAAAGWRRHRRRTSFGRHGFSISHDKDHVHHRRWTTGTIRTRHNQSGHNCRWAPSSRKPAADMPTRCSTSGPDLVGKCSN